MVDDELVSFPGLVAGDGGQGLGEALFEFGEALDGLVVGVGGFAAGDAGGDDEPDLFADVVKGEDFIEEEQAGIGDAKLVFGEGGEALDLADGVVGEEAYGTGGEGGQAGQTGGLVAREGATEESKDVAFGLDYFLPSVMVISRPRATMRLKGARPMKV